MNPPGTGIKTRWDGFSKFSAFVVTLALLVGVFILHGVEPTATPLAQSRPDEKAISWDEVRWLPGGQPDLRRVRGNYDATEERIRRNVAAFILIGLTMGKETGRVRSCEVAIESEMGMRDFLDKVNMGKWQGGQPQIQIIKENQVIQSPLGMYKEQTKGKKQRDLETFFNTKVEPGDIVVLCRIYD